MTRARLQLHPLEVRDVPAVFAVQTPADAGVGSLREAITQANALPGADEIILDLRGTIQLDTPLPGLSSALTISGPGANDLTIRPRGSNFRVFEITPTGSVTLTGVTLAEGNV